MASIRTQNREVARVFAIDDGSTDGCAELLREAGVDVIRFEANRGRGAARAASIDATAADLLFSIDATGRAAPDFLEFALPWFEDPRVAAVFGRITQGVGESVADRWRGRHLYKTNEPHEAGPSNTLITWAFVCLPSAIRDVGNFDPSRRHSEDRELGERLISAGWRVVYDPRASFTTTVSNSLATVLSRYWRWHAGIVPSFRLAEYFQNIVYAFKVLVRRDLSARDFPCALVSLLVPHYCAARSLFNREPEPPTGPAPAVSE